MTKHNYFTQIKPDFSVVNHNKEVDKYSIRKQYRFYLAEMKVYSFIPMDFRTWYKWYIYHKGYKWYIYHNGKSPTSLDKG